MIIPGMGHLEPVALHDIWHSYKDTGRQDLRNELVLHYTSLVKYVAAKVGGTLPAMVDGDDLVSYGMLGLIDAINKFDLDKGVKFETYGVARIRGAIYDEIRALDWVPRSIRSKARDIEKSRAELEMTLGRPANHEEMAQNMGLSSEGYWSLLSQATTTQIESISQPWVGSSADAVDMDGFQREGYSVDLTCNPEDLSQAGEIVDLLGEAINNMDERSKTILYLYYLQELTLADIGQILGVTESRVCQLQSKVLLTLRESLGQGGLAAA